jgi:hypothetical protein
MFVLGSLLLILALVLIVGCGQSGYVGTWSAPGGSVSLVFQSDHNGFLVLPFGSQETFTWAEDGSRVKVDTGPNHPNDVVWVAIDSGNLQVFGSESATQAKMVMTKQK